MKVLVIGAGGHAKVVVDSLQRAGYEVAGVVDETGRATTLLGHAVCNPAQAPAADGFVVAIGDNTVRKARFEHYSEAGLVPVAVVHPSAQIAEGAVIGAGAVLFAGVVVNSDAVIGENAILNTGCTVDHDCVVGAHAHVAPGVNLCGGVILGEGALLGVGSCVIPCSSVGAWAIVGAGAAVVDPIADGVTAVGVPARPAVTS